MDPHPWAWHSDDCRLVLPALSDRLRFDALITDPPYEENAFGQPWDRTGVAFDPAMWARARHLTKPGGFLAAFASRGKYHRLACAAEDAGWAVLDQLAWIYGQGMGRGQRLKPAHEPILLAWNPVRSAPRLNVDAARIAWPDGPPRIGTPGWGGPRKRMTFIPGATAPATAVERTGPHPAGRWPATVIHSGDPDVLEALGAAERFFFCAKADHREKVGTHKTQKPLRLMRWLVRLLCAPGAWLLDPFAGTGTTLEAAHLEGVQSVGIELNPAGITDVSVRASRVGAAVRLAPGCGLALAG